MWGIMTSRINESPPKDYGTMKSDKVKTHFKSLKFTF